MNIEQTPDKKKISKPRKALGVVALTVAGLTAGGAVTTQIADRPHGPSNYQKAGQSVQGSKQSATPGASHEAPSNSPPTWDLKDELANPLGGPPSGTDVEVPNGQQAPVAEEIEQVPGHPNEAKVIFGKEPNGSTPHSEIVCFSPNESPFATPSNPVLESSSQKSTEY